jgi:phosphopantothenoylcysteine decarboxylase/phosphopantothenate--cysteine ligase
MLRKKHILLGITGGIAAYKMPWLVRELRRAGAEVRVVMTEAATEFVTPLTLSTLSGADVIVGTFPKMAGNIQKGSTWHIHLAEWADLMLIAPATANVVAKLAHGASDDAVSTLTLAFTRSVLVAPAMDADMWTHAATQRNVAVLKELGYSVLPPEEGELASGLTGPGRLPELQRIIDAVEAALDSSRRDLKGKRVLVTAGPTFEAIDPVRYIGNRSSGKMGYAIARAAAERGASVTLISGPVALAAPRHVERVDVESAEEMYRAVMKRRAKADLIVMSAAVADFTPERPSPVKIKKERLGADAMTLPLRKTRDILAELTTERGKSVIVGFALETDRALANAKKKLKEKRPDLLVLNDASREGAGFNTDTNIVTLLSRRGAVDKLPKMSKIDVAHAILNRVLRLL